MKKTMIKLQMRFLKGSEDIFRLMGVGKKSMQQWLDDMVEIFLPIK